MNVIFKEKCWQERKHPLKTVIKTGYAPLMPLLIVVTLLLCLISLFNQK